MDAIQNDILVLLKEIRRVPVMYIGTRSIECLRAFIDGWLIGNGGKVSNSEIWDDFLKYLEERYPIAGTHGWERAIRVYENDSFAALDAFFRLFDEYQAGLCSESVQGDES